MTIPSTITAKQAEALLNAIRAGDLNKVAVIASQITLLGRALSGHSRQPSSNDAGQAVQNLCRQALLSLTDESQPDDSKARRAQRLLDAYFFKQKTRYEVMTALNYSPVAEGAYGRLRQFALHIFAQALARICAAPTYPDPNDLPQAWFMPHPAPPRGIQIPLPTYRRLVGREAQLKQIQAWLQDVDTHMICVHGIGGMGKTSLIIEVAQRLVARDDFADVLWVSAKQTDWVGVARYQTMMAEHSLSTDVVLDLLLMQLGLEPWTTQMPAQKQQVLPGCIGRSTLFDRPGQHRNPAG